MDVATSKSPVLSLPPFPSAPNGVESDRDPDRLGRYGDDGRESTSFPASMDLSLDHMEWVMNSLSSGDSVFPAWSPASYEHIATSPMSTNLSDTGFPVEGIGDQFHHMAASSRSRTGSVNDPADAAQQQPVFDTTSVYQGAHS